MKYEIWLYSTLVATTLTYKLADEIFDILHKRNPNTDLWIVNLETGDVVKSVNCD